MNRGKLLLISFCIVWATLIIVWPLGSNHVSHSNDARQIASGQSLYKSSLTKAGFGLLGVQFWESNEGTKRWNIQSHFAELHRKENYAFLQEVNAQFFAQHTGNIVYTKSDYGKSYIDKNQIDLDGNVSIRSKKGYLFTMDHLTYHGDKHFFETRDTVLMRGPNPEQATMQLRGTGLWADIDHEHFFLRHHVTALRRLKTQEPLRIQSNTGEFFTDDQKAIFRGTARAVMPQITVDSDEMELTIREERESILAQGRVELKNKERVGHAQTALIEIGSNRIVLEGRARIDSKGNQITGERIIMYTDDDRIDVEQAEGRVLQ